MNRLWEVWYKRLPTNKIPKATNQELRKTKMKWTSKKVLWRCWIKSKELLRVLLAEIKQATENHQADLVARKPTNMHESKPRKMMGLKDRVLISTLRITMLI